ncbi:helix-turn-helix transcriptional regulator [Kosakonia sp. BYX6]|uniref:Helix-turn-helix transcriptional regulator n=1 Tax=Kosakonia calanthes TaxID=3139408 RepID=A0ABZ3B1E1_9ENTR
MHGLGLNGYDPDGQQEAAVAFSITVEASEQLIPEHHHRKGQLILALKGAITCEVENARWMVPPHHAMWLPGFVPHSNRATPNAHLYFLFLEEWAVVMPEYCCTLKISPLVRELIMSLASRTPAQRRQPATQRLVQVLFDELPDQPQMQLQLPVSAHPKIRQMVDSMETCPAQRQTLAQWAQVFAMSERNLARLVVKETGLSFRRWRHQMQLILALRLLIGGKSVQRIAQTLGYDSTTAFITMFKKGLGQTPGRYLAALGDR